MAAKSTKGHFLEENEALIETKRLTKAFDIGGERIEAVKNVNLKISAKDFIVIYGPSGCGKSTLLNCILGIEKPSSGKVLIRGVNLYSLSEDKRAMLRASKFGVVYQMPYWVKSLNVLENVALPLIVRGIKERHALERAKKALGDMEMARNANQFPTQLSGGEQQKVGLARALAANPWIVMADEPTGNLDTTKSDELISLLVTLNKKHERTIIMVTHNPSYWEVGTRTIEMKDGRVTKEVKHG